jgi:hypothetical protein
MNLPDNSLKQSQINTVVSSQEKVDRVGFSATSRLISTIDFSFLTLERRLFWRLQSPKLLPPQVLFRQHS